MAFQGDLRNINLATVFQNLQQNMQSGTLRVYREGSERFLYIREGRIAMLSSGVGSETPVGEYLMRAGKITAEDLDSAQKRRRKGARLSGYLARAGSVDDSDIAEAIRQYVEEEIYDLFTWPDGRFEFEEGEPSEEVFDAEIRSAGLQLDPNGIILEAARRVDEWERINRVVGSLGEIYVVRRERMADVESLSDARAKRVAALLDGRRDVAAVIRDSGVGRFAACQALSRLISDRMVRPVSADELRRLAEQAESARAIDEAIRLMRKALELERNDLALRRRLAELLERSLDRQEAASEYKLLANSLIDSGKIGEAADALRRAVALAPNDVAAREKLFQIMAESGGKTVALEAGLDLAGMYSSLGLNEKARVVLEKLLALGPSDRLAIENKLVEAQLAVGDVKAAIETRRKIARRFMKSRDYDEAAAEYEKILKLDSKDDEARRRVAEIQAGVVERMLERRRQVVRSAIIATVALPLLTFVVRELASRPAETAARAASARAGRAAAGMHERGRLALERGSAADAVAAFSGAAAGFEEAARSLAEFRGRWGWTLASRSVAGELSETRRLAAESYLAAAAACEKLARFQEAHRIYTKLTRSPDVPAEIARNAREQMERLERRKLARPEEPAR